MLGLVQKHLKAGGISIKTLLLFLVIGALVGAILRGYNGIGAIVGALSGGFVGSYILHFSNRKNNYWEKFEANVPLPIWQVELSRYISHVIVFFLSLLGVGAYMAGMLIFGALSPGCNCITCLCEGCQCLLLRDFSHAIWLWLSAFFGFGALFFPMLRFFTGRLSFLITPVFSCLVMIGVLGSGTAIMGRVFNMSEGVRHFIGISIALTVFVGSYFLCLWLRRYRSRYSSHHRYRKEVPS